MTQRQIAQLLRSNEHEIRGLIRNGVLPEAEKRGQYDVKACVSAYIDHLRLVLPEKTSGSALNEVRQEIENERLKKLQFENAVSSGEYAPISLLEEYAGMVGSIVSDALEALPAHIKKRIPHLRHGEVTQIKQEIAKIRRSIVDFDRDKYLPR